MGTGLMSTMGFQELATIIERQLVLNNCGMAREDLDVPHPGDVTLQGFDMVLQNAYILNE